jgi:hypothetical protein
MSVLRAHAHAGRPSARLALTSTADSGRDDVRPNDEYYRLISIDFARAPDGCTGEDWFVYRIAQGKNDIKGYRCGSRERVSEEVQSIVTALNGRREWPKVSKSRRRAAAAARRRAAK